MRYPVHPVKLPADLRGISNGKLPQKLLAPIKPSGQLHHLAARAWNAMREAAALEGVELRHVGAMRSYEQQVQLFQERYQATPNGARVTRKWNSRTYYLRPGKAPSATPGTSNHGWGLAIDVADIGSGNRLPWLVQNAVRFGFSWEVADPSNPNFEAWHLRYFPGDNVPAAVTGSSTTPAPAPVQLKTARPGDIGPHVEAIQRALMAKGIDVPGGADGAYGPKTTEAVRQFQRREGLQVDGWAGRSTCAALQA